MEKQDGNYGLRPRRSAAKGKYREMLGINSSQENSVESRVETIQVESSTESGNKGCKIFLLPLVVSGESEDNILADNTIEIEISEDVSVAELHNATIVNEEELSAVRFTRVPKNPLNHIEEILKKNDQLIESIPEGPSFKRRGKGAREDKHTEEKSKLKK